MSAPAVRREVQQLGASVRRLGMVKDGTGTYARSARTSREEYVRAQVKAVAHELETLDQVGKDHPHLRMLTGLTDAELAVRITGAGPNSVRPRRVELVRRGLVEAVPDTEPTRWRLSSMADVLLGHRPAVHLMGEDLLDMCGTAPPGSLQVSPVLGDITCPACRQLGQVSHG